MRKSPTLLAAAFIAAALFVTPAIALAQQGDDGYDDRADSNRNPPPAGADVAYDYLNEDYYQYDGPAPQAPAVREQRGFRDGQVEREPTTSYYSGVRVVYPDSGRRRGCGCNSERNREGRDSDGYDSRNAYPYTYSYSTRRYTDQGRRH